MILNEIIKSKNFTEKNFPFNMPLFNQFQSFQFKRPITIFIGDNGTGKSTFLELLAYHADLIQINGENMGTDHKFEAAKDLTPHFKLKWKQKSKKGFFFQAESFTSFMKEVKRQKEELERDYLEIIKRDPNSLEVLPYARNLNDLQQLYGDGLEFQSHGESLLSLFKARFRPNSLYVLDEPESPLSPIKQLSLIALIKEMVNEGCQFIIATHSPMLMALPDADLFEIKNHRLCSASYDELEHVQLVKQFLENPKRYLRHL